MRARAQRTRCRELLLFFTCWAPWVALNCIPQKINAPPIRSFLLLCFVWAAPVALAQSAALVDGPDPREIPLPSIKSAQPSLPGVAALPVRAEMPAVLTMNDGTKITTPTQWKLRREEMKRTLEYYAVGRMPPPPGNVTGRGLKSETVAAGTVHYRLVQLTFGPAEKLHLDIGIFTPAQGGPFPAIISPARSPPGATLLPRLPAGPRQSETLDVMQKKYRTGFRPTCTNSGARAKSSRSINTGSSPSAPRAPSSPSKATPTPSRSLKPSANRSSPRNPPTPSSAPTPPTASASITRNTATPSPPMTGPR